MTNADPGRAGPDAAGRQVARHAGTVGAATLLSRVLGLLRDQVMAAMFGAALEFGTYNNTRSNSK